jgi:hypothetical protein
VRYEGLIRYKVEQYFEITHKYHRTGKERFATMVKENWEHLYGTIALNVKRDTLILRKQEMILLPQYKRKHPPVSLSGAIQGELKVVRKSFPLIKN